MIFWKYIKGLNQTTSSNSLYSWIDFANSNSSMGDLNIANNSPTLTLCRTQNGVQTLCGYFMLSNVSGQKFNYSVAFENGTQQNIIHDSLGFQYVAVSVSSGNKIYLGRNPIVADHYQVYIGGSTTNFNYLNSSWNIGKSLVVGSNTLYTNRNTTGYLTAVDIKATSAISSDGPITAVYFNATSDKRAKTDIKPLLIDALKLVRETQLYSFKYKETDTPSIGIIAQDVQDININGFKLVDNEEATGKDLDYMTIHESKLTYILWKAVQEQQKEIEELRNELRILKKN